MPDHFDLVVVGTGAACSSVAHPCREARWSVAVVDDRPFGGTCVTPRKPSPPPWMGAEEHINLFALAMRHGLTAGQIKEPPYGYPSHGSNTPYML